MELEILQNQMNSEFPSNLTLVDSTHSEGPLSSSENPGPSEVSMANLDTFSDLPPFVEARIDHRGRYVRFIVI